MEEGTTEIKASRVPKIDKIIFKEDYIHFVKKLQ